MLHSCCLAAVLKIPSIPLSNWKNASTNSPGQRQLCVDLWTALKEGMERNLKLERMNYESDRTVIGGIFSLR